MPLRLLVVGATGIGQRHAELLQRSRAGTPAGLLDPQPTTEAIACRQGLPRRRELGAAPAQARPDGALLATPLHVEQAPRRCEPGGGTILIYVTHEIDELRVLVGKRSSRCRRWHRARRAASRPRTRWRSRCVLPTPLLTERLPRHAWDPLQRQPEHFCAMIRGECAARVGVADAARTLTATQAIAEAARSAHAVRLD